MTDAILITRQDNVVTVALNQPETRNAFTDGLREALHDTMHSLSTDQKMRALILTGSAGVFSAGGDLKKMLENHHNGVVSGAEDIIPRLHYLHRWMQLLRDLPVPVIVAVDGPAYGAGLGLALTGDIVLASDRATFSASFAKVGAVPDGNLFYSLPRMVGLQRAKELFYTGRVVQADEAQQIGICMEVLPPSQLMDRARDIASQMTNASGLAFSLTKSIAGRSYELSSDELLALELQAQSICLASEYHKDAIGRFADRKPPKFDFS